jgi:ABC-type Mn2+/Zn2+ transport system ATPase subunit
MKEERKRVLSYEAIKPELNRFKGFKLLQLELVQHPVLGSVFYDFVDVDELSNGPYTTLILGPNGTGKSYVLRTIIEIFRRLHYSLAKNNEKMPAIKGGYHIAYCLNGDFYEAANMVYVKSIKPKNLRFIAPHDGRTGWRRKNGEMVNEDQILIPKKILASSIMLWDKFLFPAKDDPFLSNYEYMGIRSSSRSAGTQELTRRTVDYIVSNINGKQLVLGLGEMLHFIGYERTLKISYIPKYRSTFWNQKMTYSEFIDKFQNWEIHFKNRKSAPWGLGYFDRIKDNRTLIEKLLRFMEAVKLEPYGQGGKYFEYEIFSDNVIAAAFPMLVHLSKLDLVSPPSMTFSKNNQSFQLTEASSGEVQIITTLVGLFAAVEQNSLILLDEPEISLHPNLQMQFMLHLRKMFSRFESCHFIVASHSHFMVSDLRNDTSSIIAVRKSEKGITAQALEKDTFGWSAEEVLYEVFDVRSTRNFFLEYDLTKLVSILNRDTREWEELEVILDKIQQLALTEKDPLNILI